MYKFKSVYRNRRTQKTRSITFCYDINTSWILAEFFDINELWQSVIKRSIQQLEQHEVLIDIHLISREENITHE